MFLSTIFRRLRLSALLMAALAGFGGRIAMAAGAGPEIVVLDLADELQRLDAGDPAALRRHYDTVLMTSCLQGLVNRNEPRLFVRYNAAPDDFWFAKATEAGGWLAGRKIVPVANVREMLARFPQAAKGLVVWDERVPATSNVAATLAGVEDLLAVRFDQTEGSLYRELTSGLDARQVTRRLLHANGGPLFTGTGKIPDTNRETTGSAKNDAYLWLLENYIRPGKTNDRVLGFYLDGFWLQCAKAAGLSNHTLNNLDYLIAKRAAVVDLNVWEDEPAVDDPGQAPGTDLKTFREILLATVEANRRQSLIAVFGFPPWAYKYTDTVSNGWRAGGKHEAVATEWKFAETITAHNGYMDADALGYSSFPNASFYQSYPLPAVIKQDAKPTRERLIKEGVLAPDGKLLPLNYYAHYQGDFDAAAWVYWHFPKILADPARGTLPLSWAINPTLAMRFPFGMHYLRSHRAPGEVFVAGEAAGYLNPSLLQAPRPPPGLPDALDLWVAHNQQWYHQWDLDVTGFNIDGNTPPLNDRGFAAYRKFSPGGLGLQRAPAQFGSREGLPFAQMMTDLPGQDGNVDIRRTVAAVHGFFEPEDTNFVLVRSILQAPSFYAAIQRQLHEPGHFPNKLVDLPTLFWLIREFESNPHYQATRPKFADKKSVSATPITRNGLRTRRVADGIASTGTLAGKTVWQVPGGGSRYLYFDVADDFAKSLGGKGAKVRVTFIDGAVGVLGLSYDSSDAAAPLGGSYKAARPVPTHRTGRIATAEFDVPDAQFAGRQNASSDFRLDGGGNSLFIVAVEVTRN
jgi:hypothetical protein